MKDFIKKISPTCWIAIILSIILFMVFPFMDLVTPIDAGFKEDHSIQTIYATFIIMLTFLLVFSTALIAFVAWIQLSGLKKTAQSEFLFRIDERFGSEPIIKAREIIQRLYRESNNLNPGAKERVHRRHISHRIDEISKDTNSYKEYTHLLNLLDFLETISYYANENKMISIDDIKNLMGPSMEFFFVIFKLRIKDRRKKYRSKVYYCEFQKLVKTLKTKKYKSLSN